MPLYDYRCRDCGHEFEIQQSFSDDALTECPRCGGNLRKVFAPVGITFKGSGFYKTDSRSSAGGSSSSSGGSSSGGSDAGGSDRGSSSGGSSDSGSSSSSSGKDGGTSTAASGASSSSD